MLRGWSKGSDKKYTLVEVHRLFGEIWKMKLFSQIWRSFKSLPEKAMANHSSTLAWTILWMEEPGRLQSMGS